MTTGLALVPPRARRAAHRGREAALQMLYHWEVSRRAIDEVVDVHWRIEPESQSAGPADDVRRFAEALGRGTSAHLDLIDPLIAEHTEHWRPERLAVLDRLILRLAVFELLYTKTPRPVVIDEAIQLAKTFSAEASGKFINGVLDAIRRRLETEGSAQP